MLVALLFSYFFALVAANPFHKYPFVFLLDVGNEELEKTNTEQIRVSVPGGSLALRYPATSGGDTIAHVRVSGIDFGTDLKVTITDGGPGYDFVVLMFMGNPNVQYDAVLTVQTLPNDSNNILGGNNQDLRFDDMVISTADDEAANNSAEDLSDFPNIELSPMIKEDLTQAGSNIYAQEDEVLSDDYITNDNNDMSAKVIVIPSNLNEIAKSEEYTDISDNESVEQENQIPTAEKRVNQDYLTDDYESAENVEFVDKNLYDKYEALKPHLFNGVKIYPQESDEGVDEENSDSRDYSDDFGQIYDDEEIHTDPEKFKDSNNNYFDSDDSSAVAS